MDNPLIYVIAALVILWAVLMLLKYWRRPKAAPVSLHEAITPAVFENDYEDLDGDRLYWVLPPANHKDDPKEPLYGR